MNMTTFSKNSLLFVGLALLGACGPSSGGAMDRGADAGALDGSSTSASPKTVDGRPLSAAAARFVGSWTYTSGSFTLACGTDPATTQDIPVASLTFRGGAQPDEVVMEDNGCEVPCTVVGDVATARPGVTCASDGSTYTSLVYTIASANLHEVGNLNGPENGIACQLSDDAYLTRD
jgi:hypothetical protein